MLENPCKEKFFKILLFIIGKNSPAVSGRYVLPHRYVIYENTAQFGTKL